MKGGLLAWARWLTLAASLALAGVTLPALLRAADPALASSRDYARLKGYSDASWETRNSTSGWVVSWQQAAISWGSRKQKSIALSTCEAVSITEYAARNLSRAASTSLLRGQ